MFRVSYRIFCYGLESINHVKHTAPGGSGGGPQGNFINLDSLRLLLVAFGAPEGL